MDSALGHLLQFVQQRSPPPRLRAHHATGRVTRRTLSLAIAVVASGAQALSSDPASSSHHTDLQVTSLEVQGRRVPWPVNQSRTSPPRPPAPGALPRRSLVPTVGLRHHLGASGLCHPMGSRLSTHVAARRSFCPPGIASLGIIRDPSGVRVRNGGPRFILTRLGAPVAVIE